MLGGGGDLARDHDAARQGDRDAAQQGIDQDEREKTVRQRERARKSLTGDETA